MSRKITVFACLIALGTVFLASCNDQENKRAVVTVSSINSNSPFFSDVLDQGDSLQSAADDFVREDWCPVIFQNRPYNGVVFTGPDLPFNDFLITRYRVDWRRVDGGLATDIPPPYDGATSINVPSGEEVAATILLVPFEVKNTALMTAINYNGASFPDEYLMVATVTFYGHEVGTDRDQDFTAEISVSFADPVVKSENN